MGSNRHSESSHMTQGGKRHATSAGPRHCLSCLSTSSMPSNVVYEDVDEDMCAPSSIGSSRAMMDGIRISRNESRLLRPDVLIRYCTVPEGTTTRFSFPGYANRVFLRTRMKSAASDRCVALGNGRNRPISHDVWHSVRTVLSTVPYSTVQYHTVHPPSRSDSVCWEAWWDS